jgi:hypothetical protein
VKLIQIKPNLRKFSNGLRNVYFSYETPVAYWSEANQEWVLSENVWSPTTAKHLNQIKQIHPNHITVSNSMFEYRIRDYI